jgi:hypothetical protein
MLSNFSTNNKRTKTEGINVYIVHHYSEIMEVSK